MKKIGKLKVRRERKIYLLHVGWDHTRLDTVAKAAALLARTCQRRKDKV